MDATTRTRISRRRFLHLASLGLAGGALAACGQAPTASAPSPVSATAPPVPTAVPPTVPPAPTVAAAVAPTATAPAAIASKTLRLWHNWGGVWQEGIQKVADAFTQANPQYSVEILPAQSGSEGLTKFLAAVAAGDAPDLFTISAVNGASTIGKDALLPLSDYLAGSPIRTDDFFPQQLNYFTQDGVLYGIPTIEGAAGQAIIWNKAHFAEAGLDPEVGPQSFDDIVRMSEQLTKIAPNGTIERLGFDPRDARGNDLLGWWFEKQWYDAATGTLNLTSEDLTWGTDWVVEFARRAGPEQMTAYRQEYAAWTNDPRSGFVRGAQSMVMSAYYVPGELARLAPELQAGYTWVPTRDNQKTSTIYGWFWTMPRNVANPDDAWRFIEFASSLDSINTLYSTAGGYPSYKPFLEQADFSEYEGLQWFIDSTFQAEAFYTAPPLPIALGEVADRLKAGMDEMSFGRLSAAEMLAQVQDEVQALVDQARTA